MPDGATFSTPANAAPFVVLGLPRSRTAWLAAFLSHGGWTCHHEPSVGFRDLSDLTALLDTPRTGVSDSGLTLLWRHVVVACPDVRIVAVRRFLPDVIASGRRVGLSGGEWILPRIEKALCEVEALPGTLHVAYADLDRRDVCDNLFRFCLDMPLPDAWWERFRETNIQADIAAVAKKVAENLGGMQRVFGAEMAV